LAHSFIAPHFLNCKSDFNPLFGIKSKKFCGRTVKEIILKIKEHKETLTIHQILYLSNEKVVSLEMGLHLRVSKNQVLKYKKMKIVVENME